MTSRPIYLDYNATTPLDSRVLDAMMPWLTTHFGNAASRTHLYGWEAEEAVQMARTQVASLLGATAKEIVFTSGATESNNLAIKGIFEKITHEHPHFITVQTEHKAVLDVFESLERRGASVTYLAPDADGLIRPEQVEAALRPNTRLVSVMYANNETGVIQPIPEISALCKQQGVLFHSDATQAAGKLPLNVEADGIDLLSLSGHKLYGPKGVGALYVRKGVSVGAQLDGGGHERGRRSGTLNVPGIVGLGEACRLAQDEYPNEAIRLCALRDRLEQSLYEQLHGVQRNGHPEQRLSHVSNLSFGEVDGEELLNRLHRIAVSNGSACTSASVEPSHVLKAMGVSDALAYASVRFSLGKYTTQADIDAAVLHVIEVVNTLRTT
jgi:cysteine desulfurase